MAEEIVIPQTSNREEVYTALTPQVEALLGDEPNFIANCANAMAAVHHAFGFLWTGCYLVEGNELVLGPFQGPVACTRIGRGKGVCGAAWERNETIIVPDVELFPGHIACSSLSRSEIVVPIRNAKGSVIGVIDVDSEAKDNFSSIDQKFLESLAVLLGKSFGEK